MDSEAKTDAELFRSSIGHVTPLAEQNRIPHPRPSTQARVRSQTQSHHIPDILSDHAPQLPPESFLRNGLSQQTLRKLKRSTIEDSLDLHGYQGDAARRLLLEFLHEAALHQLRCVLVIHGKGMNSPGGEAVLRILTRNWLTQHPQVLAFCSALPGTGGSGAVLILLKTNS
jgi:DNA-nicking Smr family endonuclease